MVYSDFFIFDNGICISLKVPSNKMVLSLGSLTGKNRLSYGHLRSLSILPFVNLQIRSIV